MRPLLFNTGSVRISGQHIFHKWALQLERFKWNIFNVATSHPNQSFLFSYFLEDSGIITINNYQQIKSKSSCGLLGRVGLFPVGSKNVRICFLGAAGMFRTVPRSWKFLLFLLRAIVFPNVCFAVNLSSVAWFVVMLQRQEIISKCRLRVLLAKAWSCIV